MTCRFADINNLITNEQWDDGTRLALAPLAPAAVAAALDALVFIAVGKLIPTLGYGLETQTALEFAWDFARDTSIRKLEFQGKCVTNEIGLCTGFGSRNAEELDHELVQVWERFDNACKRFMIPTLHHGGFGRHVDGARQAYSNIMFDIADCVASQIETKLARPQLRERTGMKVVRKSGCLEKRVVRNNG